ncbi:NAD(P)H-binding protein [Vibrio cionasavignyae]|uniref:NAD(P)H-binding protein n=1 Tax=Vibrio cionasavignyae TaxID=2910252 RepID=UPI003D0F8024
MAQHFNVMIAGASGLVGSKLLSLLEQTSHIQSIYALCRSPIDTPSDKTTTLLDGALRITDSDRLHPFPTLGFICLGTTLKQAGSKAALEKIDYELVCDVAQTMKMVGITHIAVVSSLGASPRSLSHYLKCKGRVEKRIKSMGFQRVVFVRPGPLAGRTKDIRPDETAVQSLFKVINPLMVGPLRKFAPISAESVAKAMLYSLINQDETPCAVYDSANMRDMLAKYNH